MQAKIKKKKNRRCNYKRMSKEAIVLKYFRESRHLSMRRAGALLGLSEATINHTENGRKDLSPEFILKLVHAYGYTYQDFTDHVTGKKEVPESLLASCVAILKKLPIEKLRSIKTILESF